MPNHTILSQNIELTTESSKEPVVCKVLDCDTVTQAKEKALDAIYRNTSFSVRPSIYEVDLGQFHHTINIIDVSSCASL